jgi:pSer/pThr/pTyr-binding forkhead associated (FHA) protein
MNEQALERFREACGVRDRLVLECVAAGQEASAVEHVFECPFIVLGRHPRSDLILNDAAISRRHLYVQAIRGRILVTDLESRTKVLWDGEESPRAHGWLEPGESIQVGPYRLRHRAGRTARLQRDEGEDLAADSSEERGDRAVMPRAALELPIRSGDGPSLWPVAGELAIVGRSQSCQLTLTDESISRVHAALLPTFTGLWVIDLLAREGVHVNDQPVRWAWLGDSDALRIGRFTFIVRYDTPPCQITREDVPLKAGARGPGGPGTALAPSGRHSDTGRNDSVAHSGYPAPLTLKVETALARVEPSAIAPRAAELWEPSTAYPPGAAAMWQQQMQLMESFHHDMILMVQMFIAMHREHAASVRHELAMVQKLTQELSALESKTGRSLDPAHARPSCGSDRLRGPAEPVPARDRHTGRDGKPSADRPEQGGHRARAKSGEANTRATGSSERIASAQHPGQLRPDKDRAVEGEEIHALLTERIAELQRERQGYWQRILSTINR